MNDKEKLQLQKMIEANNVENQTPKIRELKHSKEIRMNIAKLIKAKEDNYYLKTNDPDKYQSKLISHASFLYTYYTDLFNKIKNNELDLDILDKFLNVLERIENEEIDQHEGSFIIGTLLKKLYVDSAVRKGENLDRENPVPERIGASVKINWKEYKTMHIK